MVEVSLVKVPFVGEKGSKYYFVGEAPGELEVKQGIPFVGFSGKLLDKTLFNNGLRREECRIANVMRVRPQGNDFGKFYIGSGRGKIPSPELLEGISYLKRDIIESKPNIVICLGNEAWKALSGKFGVGKWRGSVVFSTELGCKLIPTYHPALVLRQWNFFPLFSADIKKAKKEGETPIYKMKDRKLDIAPIFGQVMAMLENLTKVDMFAFDIETTPVKEKNATIINAIAFASSSDRAFCIPFSKQGSMEGYWRVEEEIEIWKRLKSLLEGGVKKIAQNAQYDMGVLEGIYGIKVNNLFLDTMCVHHVLYPELPKGLDVLCSFYTDQPYYKYMSKLGSDLSFWQYNALDACVTFEVAEKQLIEIKEEGLWDFYNKVIHPLIQILLDVQLRGVKIDVRRRDEIELELEEKIKKVEEGLRNTIGRDVNVNSPKQMKELLYGELGLPPRYKRGTHQLTTDESALRKLAAKHPSPLFEYVLGLRHLYKMLNTYITAPLKGDRMHTSYNIGGRIKGEGIESGPETGRLSSSASIIFHSGTNFQNIPKGKAREIFIPDEGYLMVGMDGSQAEARVVAYLAEEERMMKVFKDGEDIHLKNASWIFEKEEGEISKKERDFAKAHVHAFNYRESIRGFALAAGVSFNRATEIHNGYFDTYPRIKYWHMIIEKELNETRIMKTPFGRKRVFYGRWGEDLFKEATAYVPQSTVGDFTNLGLMKVENVIKEKEVDAAFLLQIHDGVVWQVRKTEVDNFIKIIKEAFHIPILIHGRELIIPIEIGVGENWDSLKNEKTGEVD